MRLSSPFLLFKGKSLDRAGHARRGGSIDEEARQAEAQSRQTALLRAGHAKPDVAERHLLFPHGRQERLPDRLHRRLLQIRGLHGAVSEPDGQQPFGGLPPRDHGIRAAPRDAHRQRPPVHQLARHHQVRKGAQEGRRLALPQPSAPSSDLGQDRTLLEVHPRGVPQPVSVRQPRGGAGALGLVDQVLQPQAAPPGNRRTLSGRPLLRDPERAARDLGQGRRGQRPRAGVARQAPRPVLHGRAHGRPERGDQRREGQGAHVGRREGSQWLQGTCI